jgi:ubiquinone/menaquinone biosynthesis C-methylase UbiE
MLEKEYSKTTFDKVATKYDEIPFFKISARHVAQIIKQHKQEEVLNVLDVACGTGNVVLECASCLNHAIFDAIDISEGMLAKAQENATQKNLSNVSFYLQDITKVKLEKKYDVITCSYALFFLPDAHEVLKSLADLLKPEGIVIFTSFLAKAFSPSTEILLPLLEKYGSSSAKAYDMNKWENLKHVQDIEHLCKLAGVDDVQINTKEIRYGMSVDEWWELMNNTGYKGMLMELTSEAYEQVKQSYYEAMFNHSDMDGEVELNADSYFVVVTA